MALEQEWDAFRRALPGLLTDPEKVGKYALIHADRIDSVWPTMDDAIQAGYDRFGIEPFLVQHVVEREEPKYFSRRAAKCPSSPGK